MDKVVLYRQYIQQLIQAKADRSMKSVKDVEAQPIFDTERDHYQLVYVGWTQNNIRDYGCLLHLDIKNGKIWIQYDGTEDGIASELLKLGVPYKDIVLGFQPARVRSDTEFAVG
ncbi:XisI protein [Nostoc sp. C052]|uniref:XisI protein n=1 Tax=Nostoc sp. C052 TaxID=2576902 RepID=UPI0015C39B19|nr:XisI protein [Nostoc sp. C052]QLE43005.1 XisI protein [Nostoc sp. C052]